MTSKLAADAPRSAEPQKNSPRRGGLLASLGALGRRKSAAPAPEEPSPEALAQLARAREIIARDRAMVARPAAEPEAAPAGPASAEAEARPASEVYDDISAWIAAELEGLAEPASEPIALAPAPVEALSGGAAAEPPALAVAALDEAGQPLLESDALFADEQGERGSELHAFAHEVTSTRDATDGGEPIRTRTMARLFASQGYLDRALAIYDALLDERPDDDALRAEAEATRSALAQKSA